MPEYRRCVLCRWGSYHSGWEGRLRCDQCERAYQAGAGAENEACANALDELTQNLATIGPGAIVRSVVEAAKQLIRARREGQAVKRG